MTIIGQGCRAIVAGAQLTYQVAKCVGYTYLFENIRNSYDRRTDLSLLKTYIARPFFYALDINKFLYLMFQRSVLPPSTQKGVISLAQTIKGLADATLFFTPFYKAFELVTYDSVKYQRSFYKDSTLTHKVCNLFGAFVESFSPMNVYNGLATLALGIKFFKDFSEGVSFISKRLFNNVTLASFAPKMSRIVSLITSNEAMLGASLINTYQSFKGLSVERVKTVSQEFAKEGFAPAKLEDSQKQIVANLLNGTLSLTLIAFNASKIFNKQVEKSRVLMVLNLLATGMGIGASVLADRWKFAAKDLKEKRA